MGLPSMGGGRAPQPNMGAPAPRPMPQGGGAQGGAPQMGDGGGSGDIRADLMALHASLPPAFQSMLKPTDPLTVLMFKRLRDQISEEEGQALLMMFANADAMAMSAAKKVWPEIMLLLDLFDDGEANNSVGGDAAGPDGSKQHERAESPSYEAEEEDEDSESYEPGARRSRLSSVMG